MADPFEVLRHLPSEPLLAPRPIEELRRRVRSRRRRRTALAVFVVVVVVGAGVSAFASLRPDNEPDRVSTRPDDSLVDGDGSDSSLSLPTGTVVAGDGVSVVDAGGALRRLSDVDMALAFQVGDVVVAQRGTRAPLVVTGPVSVLDGADWRDLPMTGDERLSLLDAGVVDGRTVAVATARTGECCPDTADERLVVIDVETGERTDLGSVGGWEAGVDRARLVDGGVVVRLTASVHWSISFTELDGTRRWMIEGPPEESPAPVPVAEGDELLLVTSSFDDDFRPRLDVRRVDLATGDERGASTLDLTAEIPAGFCSWVERSGDIVLCDQSDGPPLIIELQTGDTHTARDIARGGVATTPRTPVDLPASGSAGDTDRVSEACAVGERRAGVGSRTDVDGDGASDLVIQVAPLSTTDDAALLVCTAAGADYELPGLGQAETLRFVDVEPDGRTEILYGATTASMTDYRIAVLSAGGEEMRTVTLDGEPFMVREGVLDTVEDGTVRAIATYGCRDTDDGGGRELVLVEVDIGEASDWSARSFDIVDAAAIQQSYSTGSGPRAADGVDEFTYVRSLLELEPCGVALTSVVWDAVDYPIDCDDFGWKPLQTVITEPAEGLQLAVVVVACDAGAGTPGRSIFVYDYATSPSQPHLLHTLWADGPLTVTGQVVENGAELEATGSTYSSESIPRCCPDGTFTTTWTWSGDRYTLTSTNAPLSQPSSRGD